MPLSTDDLLLVARMRRLRLVCPFCDYDMQGAVSPCCPECGKHITERDYQLLKSRQPLPNSRWLIACIIGGCCLAAESPVATFYFAAWLKRVAWGILPLPCGTSVVIILLGMAACVWLTCWIAYRPLRVLSLAIGMKIALSVVLFGAIAAALTFFAYGVVMFAKNF